MRLPAHTVRMKQTPACAIPRDGNADEDKDAGRNGNDADRNEKEENEDGGKAADVNEAEDHNGEDDPEDEDVLTPEELGRQLSRHTATYVRPEENIRIQSPAAICSQSSALPG